MVETKIFLEVVQFFNLDNDSNSGGVIGDVDALGIGLIHLNGSIFG